MGLLYDHSLMALVVFGSLAAVALGWVFIWLRRPPAPRRRNSLEICFRKSRSLVAMRSELPQRGSVGSLYEITSNNFIAALTAYQRFGTDFNAALS